MEIKEEWKQILDTLPDESNTLDYKVKFYDLKDENGKKNKREIIEMARDVNAFLNSPREGSAFILCGVTDKKQIVGLGNQFINADLVYSCLEEYIEITAKINVENFVYDEKSFCIIEIDIPFQGRKSRFLKEFIQINKENPNKNVNIPKNTFFFRKKDDNIINTRISHVEEVELSNWLRSQIRYEPEIEEFIDENILLLKNTTFLSDTLYSKFQIDRDKAKVLIKYRREELKEFTRRFIFPEDMEGEKEINDNLFKKFRVSKRLRIPLENHIRQKNNRNKLFSSGEFIFGAKWIVILISFPLFFLGMYHCDNIDRHACGSSICDSLKLEQNFYDFEYEYSKSECDCDKLLSKSFRTHLDKLLSSQEYTNARLLLVEYRDILDAKAFNSRLEISIFKDESLSQKEKEDLINRHKIHTVK
ncbi:ATP-binding protein [Bernardetia sp. ABR2-2B]|uniref:AlbA family DNA-binding domain-containing protein n=1 Tax=Bernardetia sp. ABR2-2B TaxID=3127472 RepID=UPI0030CF1BE2